MTMNNETYFEFDNDLYEGFTTIPNYILNDTRLSYKAVGVYVQILQYRNTGSHKVYLKSLSNYRSDKRTAVSSGMKELEEFGYISKIQLRNEKGHMKGIKYIVRMKPIVQHVENTTYEPKSENLISDNPTSDFTQLKIKYNKNKINKKENKVVVVEETNNTKTKNEEKENKLIDLYKSFVLEKRVMPHTLKLLKENIHISLDVFNEIFISASDESVKKKYAYIKEIIDTLNKNNIKTLDEFNKFNNEYKESKNKYKYNKTKKDNNLYQNNKNSFNNFDETFTKYTEEEFEQIVHKSQFAKYSSNKKLLQDDVQDLYDIFEK